ncbi:MAG: hypothetical protein QME61_01950 [Patescibacteria group bacterium]|nr:hypothetical protein [Patescibacteria group bacterium]
MPENQRKILIIEDEIDLKIVNLARKLKILGPIHLENLLVVCCNYSLLDKARAEFKEVKYIFDLVNPDSIQYQAYREGEEAALFYFQKTKEDFDYLHYALLEHLKQLFYDISFSQLLIQEIIKESRAGFLIVLPYRKTPFIGFYKSEWFFGSKNSIFSSLLYQFSEVKTKKIPWWVGIIAYPGNFFQFLPWQRVIEWLLFFPRRAFRKKLGQKEGKAVIINWGADLARHTNLAELSEKLALTEKEIVHLIWEKEPSPFFTNQRFFYKRPLKNYLKKIGFILLILHIFGALKECFSIIRSDDFFQGKFYSRELVFVYFYLYFYGTAIVEGYRAWLLSIFKKFPPELLITSDIANCIGRTFVFTARDVGARVYTFSHGCFLHIPWIDPSRSLGDRVLVSGPAVAELFQKAGIERERIEILGGKKTSFSFLSLQEKSKRVAIVTPMKMGSWTEPRNLKSFFRTIENLTEMLLKDGFEIVIKPHKLADYWEFYENLILRYQKYPIQLVKRRWREEEFSSCYAAIFPGGVSTTILNCLAAGVPIVYIDILSRSEKEILKYDYADCGAVVKTATEAAEAVKKLFSNREYLENILKKGKQFYKKHIDPEKNFADEMTKLLKFSK